MLDQELLREIGYHDIAVLANGNQHILELGWLFNFNQGKFATLIYVPTLWLKFFVMENLNSRILKKSLGNVEEVMRSLTKCEMQRKYNSFYGGNNCFCFRGGKDVCEAIVEVSVDCHVCLAEQGY